MCCKYGKSNRKLIFSIGSLAIALIAFFIWQVNLSNARAAETTKELKEYKESTDQRLNNHDLLMTSLTGKLDQIKDNQKNSSDQLKRINQLLEDYFIRRSIPAPNTRSPPLSP